MSLFDVFRKSRLLLAILAITFSVPYSAPFAAGQNQTASAVEGREHRAKMREKIDISKIQWPLPPAVPRIQMLSEISGEEAAPVVVEPPRPAAKRTWKERLAGLRKSPEQPPPVKPARRFTSPYGVTADSEGRIYAADSAAHAIVSFDQDGKNFSWYTSSIAFKNVAGLAIDNRDRLFVTDSDLHRITVISSAGRPIASFGINQLVRPAGAAIDTLYRQLYVADPAEDRIAVFDIDTFGFVRFIGAASKNKGSQSPGVLNKPTNVAIDPEGRLYVSDTLNSRIQVFENSGRFLRAIGTSGSGPGTLFRPKGIAIDCDGHIWVADTGQSRIQVFDQQGHLLAYFGHRGDLPGQFVLPSGLFVDKHNRVIVSDPGSGRVQIFRYITESEAAAMKSRCKQTDKLLSLSH